MPGGSRGGGASGALTVALRPEQLDSGINVADGEQVQGPFDGRSVCAGDGLGHGVIISNCHGERLEVPWRPREVLGEARQRSRPSNATIWLAEFDTAGWSHGTLE